MASSLPQSLRDQVEERARFRCEYCLIHQDDAGFPHQIDHIVSLKHGGDSCLDNLALACVFCNRYKGSDVATIDPESGLPIRLFHPRTDLWDQHFRFVGSILEAYTPTGLATIRILRLNEYERIAEREVIFSFPHQRVTQ